VVDRLISLHFFAQFSQGFLYTLGCGISSEPRGVGPIAVPKGNRNAEPTLRDLKNRQKDKRSGPMSRRNRPVCVVLY
jgi:hypothetical protein